LLVPSPSTRDFLEQASRIYETALAESPEASEYLETRGLTPESARSFRLGVVVERPPAGHENYVGRLSIPYITRAGIVSIRFRRLPPVEDGPKYLSATNDPPRLYNVLDFFKPSDTIAICEGEIDTQTASALCGIPSVGVQGVENWKPYFRRPFKGYKRVLILADGDPIDAKTGKRPGEELARVILRDLEEARPVYMPEGEDVNSIVCKYGPSALRDLAGV
jgi:DNA primase